jgi:hypothetical protein
MRPRRDDAPASVTLSRESPRDPIFYEANLVLGDLEDQVAPASPSRDVEITAEGGGNDVLSGAAECGAVLRLRL